MCTVTFIPRRRGYCLAMNRDEQLTRSAGLPPKRHRVDGRTVLHPSEPAGGTWISVNDAGVGLSLINWYAVARKVSTDPLTRGSVILAARAAPATEGVEAALGQLPLQRINPFRLIGIFPQDRKILEWRWDLQRLTVRLHPWRAQQWISSGLDEARAQATRTRTFQRAQRQPSAGTLEWLRRLHRSHWPEPGPFSICMHRAGAATVSCTEITVSSRRATMRYRPMPPENVKRET